MTQAPFLADLSWKHEMWMKLMCWCCVYLVYCNNGCPWKKGNYEFTIKSWWNDNLGWWELRLERLKPKYGRWQFDKYFMKTYSVWKQLEHYFVVPILECWKWNVGNHLSIQSELIWRAIPTAQLFPFLTSNFQILRWVPLVETQKALDRQRILSIMS